VIALSTFLLISPGSESRPAAAVFVIVGIGGLLAALAIRRTAAWIGGTATRRPRTRRHLIAIHAFAAAYLVALATATVIGYGYIAAAVILGPVVVVVVAMLVYRQARERTH
jgi:drug/metabolite transporter (DMT)-like permease